MPVPDQRDGRAIVPQLRLSGALQLPDDLLGQNLAQLHAPLSVVPWWSQGQQPHDYGQVEAGRLGREGLAAARILGKERAQGTSRSWAKCVSSAFQAGRVLSSMLVPVMAPTP